MSQENDVKITVDVTGSFVTLEFSNALHLFLAVLLV